MIKSCDLGHCSVALYRITRFRHEPGCSVAGNGLLTNFQCRFFRLNFTLDTCRQHSPTLHTETVRSAQVHAGTPPKHVEPVTAILPEGASPLTATRDGLAGSLLTIEMVAAFAPNPVGWNRIGTGRQSPAPTTTGNDSVFGTRNSVESLVMCVIDSAHSPLLLMTTCSSANEFTQTSPKRPLFAISETSLGVGAVPVTWTTLTPASLLTVIFAPSIQPDRPGSFRSSIRILS